MNELGVQGSKRRGAFGCGPRCGVGFQSNAFDAGSGLGQIDPFVLGGLKGVCRRGQIGFVGEQVEHAGFFDRIIEKLFDLDVQHGLALAWFALMNVGEGQELFAELMVVASDGDHQRIGAVRIRCGKPERKQVVDGFQASSFGGEFERAKSKAVASMNVRSIDEKDEFVHLARFGGAHESADASRVPDDAGVVDRANSFEHGQVGVGGRAREHAPSKLIDMGQITQVK